MKTLLAIITKTISTTAVGSIAFVATQIISPLKTKPPLAETHIPRLTIHLDEFSPAWSAMEDDYRLGDYEEETIPNNIVATTLVAGQKDYFNETEKITPTRILIPQISLKTSAAEVPTTDFNKLNGKVTAEKLTKNSSNEQSIYNIPHYWLRGKIELTGGLAFTSPQDQVYVGWFRTEEVERKGIVSIKDGTYELKVDRMDGEVIAQLIDSKGYVLGEAIVDLEVLSQQRSLERMIIDNVDIKIIPIDYSAGRTVSVYNTKTHTDVVPRSSVRVGEHDLYMSSDEKGQLTHPVVSQQSVAMVSTSKAQFRDSLSVVDFSAKPQLRMFPEKFLKALFETTEAPKAVRDMGMIWGMVTKNDEPVSNYRVQLVKHREYDPLYFSFYIADKSRKETSSDGQFVLMGLPDGDYELELLDSTGKVVDGKVVAVRAGFVSQSEFEIGRTKTIHIRPFDPLSSTKVELSLAILGLQDSISAKTETFIPIPILSNKDPLVVFSKLETMKTPSSSFASRQKKFQEVPVLNESWWEKMRSQYSIDIKQGAIVGFVDTDQPFEVFVENVSSEKKIIYFNTKGEVVEKSKGAMANGFLLYNVGSGLKTLILQTDTGLLHTEVAYIDGESVSLMYRKL